MEKYARMSRIYLVLVSSPCGEPIPGERRELEAPKKSLFPLETPSIAPIAAKEIQQEFADYFVNEGELEWQYKMI